MAAWPSGLLQIHRAAPHARQKRRLETPTRTLVRYLTYSSRYRKKKDAKTIQGKLNTAEAALEKTRAELDSARSDLAAEKKKSQKAEDDLEKEQVKREGLRKKKDTKIKELENRLANAEADNGEHYCDGVVAPHKDHLTSFLARSLTLETSLEESALTMI